jgi:hypothetical protein
MWDFGIKKYDIEAEKAKRKLRDAWEKFYTPMQLSQAKFRIKVNSRMRKGKFPILPQT